MVCVDNNKDPLGYKGSRPKVAAVTGLAGGNSEATLIAAARRVGDSDTESEQSAGSARSRAVSMFACLPKPEGWSEVKPGAALKTALAPLPNKPSIRNAFAALKNLDDDDGDDEEAMVLHLNSIAHSVKVGNKKKSQKQKSKEKIVTKSLPAGMTTNYAHAVRVMANLQA